MEVKELSIDDIDNKKVVIYGSSIGGKIIYKCLKALSISVYCFCDRSKSGTYEGVDIVSPEFLKQDKEFIIILSMTRSFESAVQYLEDIGYPIAYTCNNLLDNYNSKFEITGLTEDEKILAKDFLGKYKLYSNIGGGEKLILPNLEIFITECCTLKCKKCSHLIPYYNNPQNYDIDKCIYYLEKLLNIIDEVKELYILGGEPLLHPRLADLLKWSMTNKKIKCVTIITNGTILPNCELLQIISDTGTRIRISDYGEYSKQSDELIKKAKEYKIECFKLFELWTDMGEIKFHKYTLEERKKMLADCPFSNDYLLLKGKFYRCAHIAHLCNLGVYDEKKDFFDLDMVDENNKKEKRKQFCEYLSQKQLYGCSYCNGIENSISGIMPGEQQDK